MEMYSLADIFDYMWQVELRTESKPLNQISDSEYMSREDF